MRSACHDHVAIRVEDARGEHVVAVARDRTPRQRLSATVFASLTPAPSKFSASTERAVDRELDLLPGLVLDRDLGRGDRRRRIGLGRQPLDAGRERRDVDAGPPMLLLGLHALAQRALHRAARAAQHDADRLDLRRLAAGAHELERRVRFEARTFDHDVDAAVGGEAGRILAGLERLVGAVALDVHARRGTR